MRGPNRTYIEMMLDLVDRGKTVLPKKIYKECEKICHILHEKPEITERVVQMRIKIYKEFNKYDGYHRLMNYQKFIIDYIIICKLIGNPCYITMPYRAGKTIFYKILFNMWYGKIMMERPSKAEDGAGWAFSTEKEIDEAYQYYMEKNFDNMAPIEKKEDV